MIRYRYKIQVQPPAPFVHVSLVNPADGQQLLNVPAQVDTAADRTVLPDAIVRQLGLPQTGVMSIGGLGGITYNLPTHIVLINIADAQPAPLKIVASTDEPWILLGRDFLNAHRMLLDGPQGVLEIGKPHEN